MCLLQDVILPGTEGNFFDLMDEIHEKGIDVRVLFWSNPAFSGNFSGSSLLFSHWLLSEGVKGGGGGERRDEG